MRTFEERLAEIGRRSDKIIKKRKTRNRVLALCIPLVLCLGLCVPLLLPHGLGDTTAENVAGPAGGREELYWETQAAAGEIKLALQEIRVEGCGISIAHSDAEDLEGISDLLEELTAIVPESSGTFGANSVPNYSVEDNKANFDVGDTMNNRGYAISVVSESGTTEYHLQGPLLKNLQTGQVYVLSEKDYFALKDALGIPLY